MVCALSELISPCQNPLGRTWTSSWCWTRSSRHHPSAARGWPCWMTAWWGGARGHHHIPSVLEAVATPGDSHIWELFSNMRPEPSEDECLPINTGTSPPVVGILRSIDSEEWLAMSEWKGIINAVIQFSDPAHLATWLTGMKLFCSDTCLVTWPSLSLLLPVSYPLELDPDRDNGMMIVIVMTVTLHWWQLPDPFCPELDIGDLSPVVMFPLNTCCCWSD